LDGDGYVVAHGSLVSEKWQLREWRYVSSESCVVSGNGISLVVRAVNRE
jgi:hypothetical protein